LVSRSTKRAVALSLTPSRLIAYFPTRRPTPTRAPTTTRAETDSIELWARLHIKDLEIRYRGGTYNPDFLAAENGRRWIIETKADRDIATEHVQAKRKAAEEWANIVNADAQADAKWGYVLVSESDLAQAKEDWPALVQHVAVGA